MYNLILFTQTFDFIHKSHLIHKAVLVGFAAEIKRVV